MNNKQLYMFTDYYSNIEPFEYETVDAAYSAFKCGDLVFEDRFIGVANPVEYDLDQFNDLLYNAEIMPFNDLVEYAKNLGLRLNRKTLAAYE